MCAARLCIQENALMWRRLIENPDVLKDLHKQALDSEDTKTEELLQNIEMAYDKFGFQGLVDLATTIALKQEASKS